MADLDILEKSILLLAITEDIINKRRWLEQACGYSKDYGNDHMLIRAITNHLSDPKIKPIVARVKELMEMDESNDNL